MTHSSIEDLMAGSSQDTMDQFSSSDDIISPSETASDLLTMASEAAQDSNEIAVTVQSNGAAIHALNKALSPASAAMNALSNIGNTGTPLETKEDTVAEKTCEHNQPEANDDIVVPPSGENNHHIAMPRPTNVGRLNTSFLLSGSPRDRSPVARNGPVSGSPSVRNISAGFNSISLNQNFSIAGDRTNSPDQTWNSAVGKANLGKSGRVIEKLMAENDMLKRDLQIARLAVDESKQDVKMMEIKMEALSSEYEAQIHEAQVTKAMLKKRDRQVTELKAAIDGERDRANHAVESERNWRSALEKTEVESRAQVDLATSRAMLMEVRYNTVSGHWKEEGAVLEAKIGRARNEIESLQRDRVSDAKKLHRLDELLEQRDHALNRLTTQKKTMEEIFEQYKMQQENDLSGIKQKAQQQDNAIASQLLEMQTTLGQLRWVFAVQNSLRPESEEQVEGPQQGHEQ